MKVSSNINVEKNMYETFSLMHPWLADRYNPSFYSLATGLRVTYFSWSVIKPSD